MYNEFLQLTNKLLLGTSLGVQWLGLGAFTAGGMGSIPGQGTKILQAMRLHQIKKETDATEKWKYTYEDISPKKIYKWPMCTGEDVQPDYPDQNYNKIPLYSPKMDIIKDKKEC